MSLQFTPAGGLLATLDLLRIEVAGPVAHVRLNRPAKRNAVNDALVSQLHTCFVNLPEAVRAVVLPGEGEHFCAGLDLSEISERSVAEGVLHSRAWHAAMDALQFGRVPVIAVLHGAVVGSKSRAAHTCAWPKRLRITACPKDSAASSSAAAARRACRGSSASRA